MTFPIEKFVIKPGSDPLTHADFESWPAWSEHYDFEEIDDIQSWGIDREWALSKFREYDTGGSHPHYTILDLENLQLNNMRIYLKATFHHYSGTVLTGYIMNLGEMCISLFSQKTEYLFTNHPMFAKDMEAQAKDAEIEYSLSKLFPLPFSTEFKDHSGEQIRGIYQLNKNVSVD